MNHGWTNPDPVTATKEVIGPTMLGLSGMIALPAMLFLIANTYVPSLQLGAKATCKSPLNSKFCAIIDPAFSHLRLSSYLRIGRRVWCRLLDVQEPPRLVTGGQGQGIFGRNATAESYPRDS